ncbi:hypothetical protein J3459_006308 [Metarhizium acridum]|nr:hypothetical protein J3459_006308 [Metarhizium acridum]
MNLSMYRVYRYVLSTLLITIVFASSKEERGLVSRDVQSNVSSTNSAAGPSRPHRLRLQCSSCTGDGQQVIESSKLMILTTRMAVKNGSDVLVSTKSISRSTRR